MEVDLKPGTERRRLPMVAVVGAIAVLGWCAWRVLSLGMADHLAASDPDSALAWRGDHPVALLGRAERQARSLPDSGEAAALTRRAVAANPLSGYGYRLLGELYGESGHGRLLHGIAVQRSPRDPIALARLVDHALHEGEHALAVEHLDQLLRVRPTLLRDIHPVLEGVATVPAGREALIRKLASAPPWRGAFLGHFARQAGDIAPVSAVFDRLRRAGQGLNDRELDAWLDRLIAERHWQSAYLLWVSHLPIDEVGAIGNVFNGDFTRAPSNSGFDWRASRSSALRFDFAATEDGSDRRALRIAFEGGQVPARQLRQLLALSPGEYRLLGQARADRLVAADGLTWTLSCATGGSPIGRSEPLAGTVAWHEFEVGFVVPDQGCGGQWLALQLLESDAGKPHFARGVAWFDELRVVREETLPVRQIAASGRRSCRWLDSCFER